MHDYFDLLVDKTGNPYFISSEKDLFLNMAQTEYIKRTLPSNEGGVVNLEESAEVTNNIVSLIWETASLTMDSNGLITAAQIQTALNTVSLTTEPYIFVMNVSWKKTGTTYPVQYTSHNDWFRLQQNSYRQGVATRPRYRYNAAGFVFAPIDVGASVYFSLLKRPVDVGFDIGQDSELPDHTHKNLVELAVELASVATREGDLSQLNQKQLNG